MRAPMRVFRYTLTCMAWLAAGACQSAAVDIALQSTDGKPLADGALFLESKEARAALKPAVGVEIEQAAKQFTHRVTVVPLGSEVVFPNRDKVRHHVYSFSAAKNFELKLYNGTPSNPVLFDKPGIAVLGCNIHDNMLAWVVVVETPYYGLTGAPGQLHLDNVPAGNYMLRAWHPLLPPGSPALEQPLVVSAGNTAVTVRLPVPAAPH
jgi:plastocyanin